MTTYIPNSRQMHPILSILSSMDPPGEENEQAARARQSHVDRPTCNFLCTFLVAENTKIPLYWDPMPYMGQLDTDKQ